MVDKIPMLVSALISIRSEGANGVPQLIHEVGRAGIVGPSVANITGTSYIRVPYYNGVTDNLTMGSHELFLIAGDVKSHDGAIVYGF